MNPIINKQNENGEEILDEDSQPLCIQCLTPFNPPLQHYCSNCGSVVGSFTRYIPFVNIPFEIEFFAKTYKKFWRSKTPTIHKIGLFPIIILFWGPFFLIGLPFELWKKYKGKV